MSRNEDNKPIENVLLHANPNPERVDCPTREELIGLALRVREASDPLWNHVSGCSPCFADVLDLQRKHDVQPEEEAPRRSWIWLAAAAALLVVAGGAWYSSTSGSQNSPVIVARTVPSTVLDLRPFAVSRSEEVAKPLGSLSLERKVQNVVLVLPVASAEGAYSLRLLDADLNPRLSTSAVAAMVNGDTSITKELDLAAFPEGRYTLAIKRDPEDWRLFPVELR
jgi:hypothetical protein